MLKSSIVLEVYSNIVWVLGHSLSCQILFTSLLSTNYVLDCKIAILKAIMWHCFIKSNSRVYFNPHVVKNKVPYLYILHC